MTPQELQAIAQGMVDGFTRSLPTILTQLNQQKRNNQTVSGSRAPIDPLENDLHRATVRRIKQERDVTHSLVSLLQSRNKELKHIHKFNTMMVDLIRQQGTYDNLTNRMSSNLKDTIRDSSKEFSKLFEQMHNVGDGAKKINGMMDNAISQFQTASNANNSSGMDKVVTSTINIMRSEMIKLVSGINADTGMTQAERLSVTSQLFNISNSISALETNPYPALNDVGLGLISSNIKTLNEMLQKRDDTFTPQMKKIVSELGVDSSELIQKLEHVEDFYRTYGDAFPEPADLKQLNAQLGDLAYQQKMFNLTGEKTADEVQTFTNQMTNTFNELFRKIDALVAGVRKNTNTLNWKDLITNIKDLDKDKASSTLDQIEKSLKGFPKYAVMLAKYTGKYTMEGLSKIAEDQLNVQKYGVNMTGGVLDATMNYEDATRAGISPAQMAQWKQENRVVGGTIGGERTATDQFKHFMGAMTDKDATKVTYNGQEQTFSELIGGDSQYKKETYDSIVQSLVKNGIVPTEKNIKTSLTKDDNGIMKVAYKLGLLPKELTDFHTSLTESAAFNVTAMNGNSEAILNSVDGFQLLGQKLGLSTTATQALTKQMYDDSHKKGADMLKTGIVARIVAKQLGFSDKEAAQIGKMNQMQGNMLNQYLAKNPEQGKLYKQFVIKTEQSRQSELIGDSLQAHPMAINAIMESNPALMSNLNMLSGLANQNKATGQGVDPTKANNKELNSFISVAAQEWKNIFNPAQADIVSKTMYALNAAGFLAGKGAEAASSVKEMFVNTAHFARWKMSSDKVFEAHEIKMKVADSTAALDRQAFNQMYNNTGPFATDQEKTKAVDNIVNDFEKYAQGLKKSDEQLKAIIPTNRAEQDEINRDRNEIRTTLVNSQKGVVEAINTLKASNSADALLLLNKAATSTELVINKKRQK